MAFNAQYTGTCTNCSEGIKVGELIESDGDFGYRHAYFRCPEPKPICPACHMQKPCDCE